MKWQDNDDLFLRELKEGRQWEFYVAMKLLQAGIWVHVPLKSVRKSIEEAPSYANEADIWVMRRNPMKIEVKSSRSVFTCPKDVPPNRRPFIITTQSSWENAETKPAAVVIVSQQTRGIIVASGKRSGEWEVQRRYDHFRRIHDNFLLAPVGSLYEFDDLVEALQKKEATP